MKNEKDIKGINGYLMLIIMTLILFGSVYQLLTSENPLYVSGIVIAVFLIPGFMLVIQIVQEYSYFLANILAP